MFVIINPQDREVNIVLYDFTKHPSILIQGAMDVETELLISKLQDKNLVSVGNWMFYTGFLTNKKVPVVISRTRVGMVNCAAATSLAMVYWNPKIVINQGVAGGHDPRLHRGDIVIGERVVNMGSWEFGYAPEGAGIDPFLCSPKKTTIYECRTGQEKRMTEFMCDSRLVEVAAGIDCSKNVLVGTMGSADEWNNQLDRITMLREHYQTLSEDMETAASAQICNSYGIPFIGIRALSNTILHQEEYDRSIGTECQKFILRYVEALADSVELGLLRGTVRLEMHNPLWDINAGAFIARLIPLLKGVAIDIQHVGSTAIQWIHAKPIIDMVIGVRSLDAMLTLNPVLDAQGIIYRKQDHPGQLLYVMGDFEKDTRTHHLHVVEYGSDAWNQYLNFRDYLNACPEKAQKYDELKLRLSTQYANDRGTYTAGKAELINQLLQEADLWRKGL